jgi:glycosyltransferase involved in cell wall biosynthesis
MPLVSILIPAFNAQDWIADTIQSAVAQTWPRKEIIVVDDGSTDQTLAVARQHASDIVHVVTKNNAGAASARNKAYSMCQGDYIQWLDADDLLAPNKISLQMEAAASWPNGMAVFSSSFLFFYWRLEKAWGVPDSLWKDLRPIEYLILHLSQNQWMSPAVWLVSRSLTERVGPWDERLSLNDDGEYFSRVIAASELVKFVQEAKCYYRLSGLNQLSRSSSESSRQSFWLSIQLCIACLIYLEDSERTRLAALSRLQSYVESFFPEEAGHFREVNELAIKLGGELPVLRLNQSKNILNSLFGPKLTKKTLATYRKLRLVSAIKFDEALYRLSSSLTRVRGLLR